MSATPAQLRSIAKWDKANYDKVALRLPKGYKEKILEFAPSMNSYLLNLVKEDLAKRNISI